MERKISYFDLKNEVLLEFKKVGLEDDIADFDWICCEVTGKRRSELGFIQSFSNDELNQIKLAIEKRLQHIPLAYIFGKTNFYGYDFIVNSNVLIPRLDTEVLVERVIDEIKSRQMPVSVLDVGTGSGAIAITLNKETGAKVIAVDVSEKALDVAKKNAQLNNAEVEFVQSNLFSNLYGLKVDIMVSNPPYIESSQIDSLEAEVRDNEPILALDGGLTGLEFYEKIVQESDRYLNANGKLFFEIGFNQGLAVSEMMKLKFKNVQIIKDYLGQDRVVMGEL